MGDILSLPKSQLYVLPLLGAGGTTSKFISVLPDDRIIHVRDDVVYG